MPLSADQLRSELRSLPLVDARPPACIGYVVNYSFHIWYKVVIQLMKARAEQYGIEAVLIEDAQQDLGTELSAMDRLIDAGADILVVTPVASPDIRKVVDKAKKAAIPLVLEANPVPGMTTMVAICDYDAGKKAGRWVGNYVRDHLGGSARVLDIAYPPLRPCLNRSEGFMDGLRQILPDAELVKRVNGEAVVEISARLTREAFHDRADINVIFGMDDESIHGGLHAVEELGVDQDAIVLAGFGMAGDEDKEILRRGGCWKVSTAMFPEWVGLRCIDQAVKVFNEISVQAHDVAPTVAVTADTITGFYKRTGDGWLPRFAAIAGIPREAECERV